ncbi:uncharacterized protein LOC110769690 [Prunus avium]|uniref:Uncharacterized protein LOC110769690 n=1 Tax=Prunus avium TaxID=42229 RepID=A0A6P5TQI7_PRUAV|nr:uncharacterized protein LOC110769690 [Prunus avium]
MARWCIVLVLALVVAHTTLKVASKRKPNLLTRFTGIFIKGVNLHQIGSDIEKITTKISQLSSILPSLNLHQTRESGGDTFFQRQQERRIAYPHIVDPHVVGLARGTEILATHLIKEKGPRVVSIWGMPGLGKTTLAKQVYNHGEVKRHFNSFAWVCISQQCQAREILEEILTKLISPTNEQRQEIAKLKIDQIAERLWNTQRERKCLVVLDDIWTSDAWSSLQAGFPMNEETESRILLSTRNTEVALYADKNGFLFEPQSLNDDESWELFEKIAMSRTEDTNHKIYEHKKELGTEMLQHCKGLPLAITVLAGLLARKDTVDEWNTVHKNVYAYIRRGTDLGPDYKAVEIKQTPNGRVRRLAIYLDEKSEVYCPGRDENYGHVRSLLYFVSTYFYRYCYWNSKVLRLLLRGFTLLRVLKFEGMVVGKLPGEIGNLVHLMFLSVKDSDILAVPSSITNLVCLQTLDLRSSYDFLKIPNRKVFSKMEKLRHIYLPPYHTARKKRLLFEAVNLHTVVNMGIPASSDPDDFVKLTNLRKLGVITFDGGEKKEKGTNIIFKHLHSLSVRSASKGVVPWNIVLSCPKIYKLRLLGHITELREDLLCLRNLTKLTLSGFGNLKDNHIKVLEKLPSLRMLFANFGNFPASLVCSKGSFPFLKFLSLDWLSEFKEWKVEKGAMTSLCRLHIEFCLRLEAVPDGLQHITTLKELTIKRMLPEFCSRLKEGGEDFYKIQHVQSVSITSLFRQL